MKLLVELSRVKVDKNRIDNLLKLFFEKIFGLEGGVKNFIKRFFTKLEAAPVDTKKISKDGVLGQFDLWEWWSDSFSDEEKRYILERYNPFPGYPQEKSVLTHGSISIAHPRSFLSRIALWFNNVDGYSIALKFMNKAQEYPISDLSVLDYHFDCDERVMFYYRWRNEHEGALDSAIRACKEQIGIASDAAPACLEKFGMIPRHGGYDQLAIIYEKQGQLEEAIAICEQGRAQGWANDFDKRLARLNKKLAKLKDKK